MSTNKFTTRAVLVNTDELLATLHEEVKQHEGIIAVDTETNGLMPFAYYDKPAARIVGVSISLTPDEGYYIPVRHKVGNNVNADLVWDLLQYILDNNPVVAHHFKFDGKMLSNEGINIYNTDVHDTMIMSQVWYISQSKHGLKHLSSSLLGYTMRTFEDTTDGKLFDELDPEDCYPYAADDASVTLALYKHFISLEGWEDAVEAYEIERNAILAYVLMELTPIQVDKPALDNAMESYSNDLVNAKKILSEIAPGLNINSPKQLVYYMFDEVLADDTFRYEYIEEEWGRTDTGNKKADKNVMHDLHVMYPDDEFIQALATAKTAGKILGTYLSNIKSNLYHDNTIHIGFRQIGAETGRSSAVGGTGVRPTYYKKSGAIRKSADGLSGVNVQNIPMKSLGHLFLPMPGCKTIVADYSSEELCLAAILSGEESMIEAFRQGIDAHKNNASLAFGIPPEEVTPAQRKLAKALPTDTLIPTDKGVIKIGDITTDHRVYGSDGELHKVLGVYPQGIRPMNKVIMNTGDVVIADDGHLWTVHRNEPRKGSVTRTLTTQEIKEYIAKHPGYCDAKFRLDLPKPIKYPEVAVPIDPYLLGVLIGDGSFSQREVSLSNTEKDVVERAIKSVGRDRITFKEPYTYCFTNKKKHYSKVKTGLNMLGLRGKKSPEKFVPDVYKYNSVEVRLATLQGLIDTDGTVLGATVIFGSTSKQLADDVAWLVRSLGGVASVGRACVSGYKGKDGVFIRCHDSYNVNLHIEDILPFSSEKHLSRATPRKKSKKLFINEVVPTEKADAVCIHVDAPDSLFLLDSQILSHNTLSFAMQYGAGKYTVAKNMNKNAEAGVEYTPDDAEELLNKFFSRTPKLTQWLADIELLVEENGWYATNELGGVRPLEQILRKQRHAENHCYEFKVSAEDRSYAYRRARSQAIQGLAALLLKHALAAMTKYVLDNKDEVYLHAVVHDSVIMSVKDNDNMENHCREIERILRVDDLFDQKGWPKILSADAEVHDNWEKD